jgi:type IV pilus assembly protein PilV
MRRAHYNRRARGFSLVEVLVALIVIAVGLLGIATMQALALASTTTASMRSLAAMEAASLAASMHSNRAFWASGLALQAPGFTVAGSTLSPSSYGTAVVNCTSYCDKTSMATYDLQQWAAALSALLPNVQASVICSPNVGVPVTCTITISWSEKVVAANAQAGNAMQGPSYTLLVEP